MEALYEMWVHTVCDFEPEPAAKVGVWFERGEGSFGSGNADRQALEELGVSGELSERFSKPEYFKTAQDIVKYCENNGIRIITKTSSEYPECLKNTNTAPRLLFAKGEPLDLDSKPAVAVVGCRKPTAQGRVLAHAIGKSLAENGIVTISGMAEGIDGEAHCGAVSGGGKTIAVLAGGVDTVYPKCNERIYRDILKNGTVVSERPPKTVVKRYFYQQRNRIIVGLALGTVFVEGEEKSGTAITARLALENNRDIFAVPGSPMNKKAELPNRLLSEGAIIVNRIETPAEYYKEQCPRLFKENTAVKKTEQAEERVLLTDDERILNYLAESGDAVYLEDMAEALGLGISVLSGRLTVLCIKGKIRQESGNRYILIK